MRYLVLSTHDYLSKHFKEAATMIAGKKALANVRCFCMTEGKDQNVFLQEVGAYLSNKEDNDEYLILTDLYGSSPTNTCLLGFRKENYRIVTGLNLGMLLEALFILDSESLDEVANKLVEKGKEGITKVYLADC